jgi:hypothetical protein
MMGTPPEPKLRKPLGVIAMIALLAGYSLLVARLWPLLGGLHPLLELAAYLVLGFAWVPPMMPLVAWIETGRWRRVRRGDRPATRSTVGAGGNGNGASDGT